MPTEISRAYVAGYFDAEGCVRAVKSKQSKTWQLRVSFGQTDATVIKKLAKKYGGGLYQYRSKKKGEKVATYWIIGKEIEAQKFLRDVSAYLREKCEEVQAALNEPLGVALAEKLTRLKKRSIVDEDVPVGILSKPRVKRRCCLIEGCGARHCARGFCSAHYQAALKANQFETIPKGEGRPYERRRRPTLNEKRYIAGFFDGDGCLSHVEADGRWTITFGQCRLEAVLLLHSIYGGVVQLRPAHKRRRPKITWALNQREAVRAFLDDVSPYVIEKRKLVRQVLANL